MIIIWVLNFIKRWRVWSLNTGQQKLWQLFANIQYMVHWCRCEQQGFNLQQLCQRQGWQGLWFSLYWRWVILYWYYWRWWWVEQFARTVSVMQMPRCKWVWCRYLDASGWVWCRCKSGTTKLIFSNPAPVKVVLPIIRKTLNQGRRRRRREIKQRTSCYSALLVFTVDMFYIL